MLKLLRKADVLTENFRPGALDKLGFSIPRRCKEHNPRLIYCSLKGFLKGPYEHRLALDEVTQMMGGLAYMTGLPDRPLRAGSSVIDIMGGTFAALGILAALREREQHRPRQRVTSALFESTAYLVAQHMAQFELTGEAPLPMSVKRPAWGVYDIFETARRRQALHRRRDRHAMGSLLPRVRRAAARRRSAPEDQRHAGEGARLAHPEGQRDHAQAHARGAEREARGDRACRSRRSPSPGTCSTTRT